MSLSSFFVVCLCNLRMKFSTDLMQHILTQHTADPHNNSLRALSRRYHLTSNGSTIKKWMQRWNGTATSLAERKKKGRPCILTPLQIHNHIHQPIVAANRAHRRIDYRTVHRRMLRDTPLRVSLRTMQRYGLRRGDIRSQRTHIRCPHERKQIHTHRSFNHGVV